MTARWHEQCGDRRHMPLGEVHNGGVIGPWDSKLNVTSDAGDMIQQPSTAATENELTFCPHPRATTIACWQALTVTVYSMACLRMLPDVSPKPFSLRSSNKWGYSSLLL
jgi:hypothetical protein